eukprot:2570454-Alexandrium_andersonii.AAC.1
MPPPPLRGCTEIRGRRVTILPWAPVGRFWALSPRFMAGTFWRSQSGHSRSHSGLRRPLKSDGE